MHSGNPLRTFPLRIATLVTLALATTSSSAWARGAPTPGAAADEDLEGVGARATGAGMVGVANPNDVGAMRLSMATVSLADRYELFVGGELGPDKHLGVHAGAADSQTGPVMIGLGYQRVSDAESLRLSERPGWQEIDEDFENPTVHQGVFAGVAYPFVPEKASVAVDARYDWYEADELSDAGAFNFGFSLAWRPATPFTLSAAIGNLLENDFRDTERQLRVGARWDAGTYFGLEGNALAPVRPTWDWKDVDWRLGANVGIAEFLALRAGYANDHTKSWVTGGLGLVSKSCDLDYGVRVRIDAPRHNVHVVDVRLRF